MRKWHLLAPLIAVFGTLPGIITILLEESRYLGYFGIFVAAPVLEEAFKPTGVYFILAKWPHALRRSRLYTAFLAALAGATFAVIENLLYLFVYIPDPSPQVVLYRWTVGLSVHSLCSFIVGLGINERLAASVRGDVPFLSGNRRFFFTAMLIHAAANVTGVILASQGLIQ